MWVVRGKKKKEARESMRGRQSASERKDELEDREGRERTGSIEQIKLLVIRCIFMG